MRASRFVLLVLWSLIAIGNCSADSDQAWEEIKGRNFVVYYESESDQSLAQSLLRRAEDYYQTIGADIGYSRTNKFWTWDERVKIFLFSTQSSFLQSTGQPVWSTGYADRDSRVFKSKTIVTYRQEQGFLDGLLPHEISHLILHDFVQGPIPIWFDEGVAQLQEKDKKNQARSIMKMLTQKKLYVPFEQFTVLDIRRVAEPRVAETFYCQSLSIVDFLRTKYGAEAFGRLCRGLRDHKNFQAAMSAAYQGSLENFSDLEAKWLASF